MGCGEVEAIKLHILSHQVGSLPFTIFIKLYFDIVCIQYKSEAPTHQFPS
jgi:hypothetical protein